MNTHKNARLAFQGRVQLIARVVEDHWSGRQAAAACSLSLRTVRKWLARYRAEGARGLLDRTSRPRHCPRRTARGVERRIAALRRQRLTGPQIADQLQLPVSTVGDVLRRLGLGRLPPVVPRPPIVRYERQHPGELLHVDAKRLARIVGGPGHRVLGPAVRAARWRAGVRTPGWEVLHVAIDDASRVAYAELLPDETARSARGFLERALSWFSALGVPIQRVMTDNALCYTKGAVPQLLAARAIRHVRIRPYTPRTNGKAERFIQTALREWAYAKPYRSSRARTSALGAFLTAYNTTRPHTAHGRRPPMSRLAG